jgi:hypothetical protein
MFMIIYVMCDIAGTNFALRIVEKSNVPNYITYEKQL